MNDAFILLFSLLALGFAVLVVTLRQPMRAALALVAHMISLAGIYASLDVHVVALFQVLIYVGAVMVFMVYTIMLLDDRDTSYQQVFSGLTLPAVGVAVLVATALLWSLGSSVAGDATGFATAAATPSTPAAAGQPELFSFIGFSTGFLRQYWFHFELATILLLAGILAAWTAIREAR